MLIDNTLTRPRAETYRGLSDCRSFAEAELIVDSGHSILPLTNLSFETGTSAISLGSIYFLDD
jgi:hypothetical protein